MAPPFDPIERAKEVEALVISGENRMYSPEKTIRYQGFYGGIATAGGLGCNLDCAYCWNAARNGYLHGKFFPPDEIAGRLERIADKKGIDAARISGCEPILGEASARHLAAILEAGTLAFVLETNGVYLGHAPEVLEAFRKYSDESRIVFRVSVKATEAAMWEKITGSNRVGLDHQRNAIQALKSQGFKYVLAYMGKFVDPANIRDNGEFELEDEGFRSYPGTKKRMDARGLAL